MDRGNEKQSLYQILGEADRALLQEIHKKFSEVLQERKDSLRQYTLDFYGTGNIALGAIKRAAEIAAMPAGNIKDIHLWIHDNSPRKYTTTKPDFLRRKIITELSTNPSAQNVAASMHIHTIRSLPKVEGELARREETSDEGSLLMLAPRYKLPSFSELSTEELVNASLSFFYDAQQSGLDARKRFSYVTEQRKELEKLIEQYNKETGISVGRGAVTLTNLFGYRELARALGGYKGFIMNMGNDMNITNHVLSANGNIAPNQIFGPTANDGMRLRGHINEILRQEKMKLVDHNLITYGKDFGTHGELMRVCLEDIKIGGESFQQYFGRKAPALAKRLIDLWTNYGMEYTQRTGLTPTDTVDNTINPFIESALVESTELFKGSADHPKLKTFVGQHGTRTGNTFATQPLLASQELPPDMLQAVEKGNQYYAGLVQALTAAGFIAPREAKHAPKPTYIPEIKIRETGVLREVMEQFGDELTDKVVVKVGEVMDTKLDEHQKKNEENLNNLRNEVYQIIDEKIKTYEPKERIPIQKNLHTKKDKRRILQKHLKGSLVYLDADDPLGVKLFHFNKSFQPDTKCLRYDVHPFTSNISRERDSSELTNIQCSNNEAYFLVRKDYSDDPVEYRIARFNIKTAQQEEVSKPLLLPSPDVDIDSMFIDTQKRICVSINQEIYHVVKNNILRKIGTTEGSLFDYLPKLGGLIITSSGIFQGKKKIHKPKEGELPYYKITENGLLAGMNDNNIFYKDIHTGSITNINKGRGLLDIIDDGPGGAIITCSSQGIPIITRYAQNKDIFDGDAEEMHIKHPCVRNPKGLLFLNKDIAIAQINETDSQAIYSNGFYWCESISLDGTENRGFRL